MRRCAPHPARCKRRCAPDTVRPLSVGTRAQRTWAGAGFVLGATNGGAAGGATKRKTSAPEAELSPPSLTTRTSTVPSSWAGVTAVIWLALSTEKLDASTPPKTTDRAESNPVPAITTRSPPTVEPDARDSPETVAGVALLFELGADP